MQEKKAQIYIALMFILLPCLNAHSEPVNQEEHIPASVLTLRVRSLSSPTMPLLTMPGAVRNRH